MLTKFFKQFRTEHHVAVFAPLAASDVNHHPLAVTQTYLNQQATTAPFASREASAAGRLRPNAVTGEVRTARFLVCCPAGHYEDS
jgi:hypothetical protein